MAREQQLGYRRFRYEIVSTIGTTDVPGSRTFASVTVQNSFRLALVACVAATSLAISGCKSVPVLTANEASPLPVPSAVPEVKLVDSPVPFIDLPCADMISEAELYAALGVTVSPAPPDRADWDGMVNPRGFALESLGGLDCWWDNGQPQFVPGESYPESNPNFVGLHVQVLPNAAEEWKLYTEYYDQPDGTGYTCTPMQGDGLWPFCHADALRGATWIDFVLTGPPSTDLDTATNATRPLWDAAVSRIEAAQPSSQIYVPPTDVVPLTFSCAQFVTPEEAQKVLGTVNPPFLDGSDGGWSFKYSSDRLATSFNCHWMAADAREPEYYTFNGVGIANGYLSGGEWAFERLREASPNRYDELQLAGLGSGDTAHIDCGRADECTLHLVIGHNWITFSRTEAEAEGAVPVGRQSLIRLGELTAARLRG